MKKRFRRWLSIGLSLTMLAGTAPAAMAEPGTDAFAQKLHDMYDEIEIQYRPDVRWWLAEGLNTDVTLKKNIQELYDSGFGAAEFLAMPEWGADDAIYGWGSEEWTADTQLIIREATERGMGFSLTSGTHWSNANLPDTYIWEGKPMGPDNKASAKELNYSTITLTAGETFNGELPMGILPERAAGATEFVFQGAVAAKVITPREGAGVDYAEGEGTGVLDINTINLTPDVVEENGVYSLNWTAPKDGDYVLLTYWMHGTGQTATPSVSKNYTVNYMDSYGIDALIDYWEEYILTPEIKQTIIDSGRGEIYMDSLELTTGAAGGAFWGYNFLDEFEARRNYDLTPYLPFITKYQGCTNPGMQGHLPDGSRRPAMIYDYLAEEQHSETIEKVLNDLYQTMSEMYLEKVLGPLQTWLHEDLNMQLRAEPSYGFSFEISTPAKYLDGVETETFAQSADIDLYRGIRGSANIYNRLFSSETGAVQGKNYTYNMDYWTQLCYMQFAAGINRTVFHGYSAIEGSESDTKWPGHEGMYAVFSERFNSRQPASTHYTDWTEMLARNQKVLRQGNPRVDIAILRTDYNFYEYGRSDNGGNGEGNLTGNYLQQDKATHWQDMNLQANGYTYDYFSPMILEDKENISWADGLLQPDGPGYQAAILFQETLSLDNAKAILEMAQSGVPVVFVNNVTEELAAIGPVFAHHEEAASRSMFLGDSDEAVQAVVSEIKALPNVKTVDQQTDAIAALQELGVYPRVSYSEPNLNVLTVSRQDDKNQIMYTYAYNYKFQQDEPYTVELSFDGVGAPYAIDDWTGEVTKLAAYDIKDGRTNVTVTLQPGESMLFALDLSAEEAVHAISTTAAQASLNADGAIVLRADASGDYETILSDGQTVTTSVTVPEAIAITDWNVTIEDWNEGEKVVNIEEKFGHETREVYFTTKKTELNFENAALVAWKDLPATAEQLATLGYEGASMSHVSGVGTYEGSFTLPENWTEANGAMLKLESTGGGTTAVYVNGEKAPAVDIRTLTVDISDLLKAGENQITIEVTSTLTNRLLQRDYASAGSGWTEEFPVVQDYGLMGAVAIQPYTEIII